jgi:hypothetical protein
MQLDWTGLDWTGLDWTGLDSQHVVPKAYNIAQQRLNLLTIAPDFIRTTAALRALRTHPVYTYRHRLHRNDKPKGFGDSDFGARVGEITARHLFHVTFILFMVFPG